MDTLKDTLRIFAEMVGGITVKPEAMERAALKGYATATDLADYMVKKGLPFRDAHEAVAHAVKAAISHAGVDLSELPLAVLQEFNPKIEKDVYDVSEPARLTERAQHPGRHRAGAGAGADQAAQGAAHSGLTRPACRRRTKAGVARLFCACVPRVHAILLHTNQLRLAS